MSATLKGLFGGASSKLLGSIMGRASGSSKSDAEAEEQEELWFTSLDDFKPICHMLHRGRYMTAYFACANKTGQHFLLKKFDKRGFELQGAWSGSRVMCACRIGCSQWLSLQLQQVQQEASTRSGGCGCCVHQLQQGFMSLMIEHV